MDIGWSIAIVGTLFTGLGVLALIIPRGINKLTQIELDKLWEAVKEGKSKIDVINDAIIKVKEQYQYIIKTLDEIKRSLKNGKK